MEPTNGSKSRTRGRAPGRPARTTRPSRAARLAAGAAIPHRPTILAVPEDAVRARAYEIFLARGGGHGRDLDDWLQAEREVSVALRP
jgi:hypothetical protein